MTIKLDGFYTYREMMEEIARLGNEYPDLVKVGSIGTSLEGRDLPLITITSPGSHDKKKPAYYAQANVHSNEGEGTTVLLYLANVLCSEPTYKDLLDNIIFYLVPRVNPDGTERAVVEKYVPRSREYVEKAKNHIIPMDINGDGKILKMRIRCDDGNMKPCQDDQRLMVPRQKDDTTGPFYRVYTEGLVHEWEGRDVYEPKITAVDFNRNYPVDWQMTNPLAGKYPFSEPESKAVGDFLLSKPNIFAGMDIHNGSNAIFRPGAVPKEQYDPEDLALMEKIGKICSDVTGFPYLVSGYKFETDPVTPGFSGTSDEFVHFMTGMSFYTMELGNGFNQMGHKTMDFVMTKDFFVNNNKYVCELLQFHDKRGTEFFYPWTKFEHPQLGTVEIGGITTANAYGISFPNAEIPPVATEGLITHARMYPKLAFVDVTKERLEGNLYRISGYLTNRSLLPANGMKASRGRPFKAPVVIQLKAIQGGRLVGGMQATLQKSDMHPDEKYFMEWFVLADENDTWEIVAEHPRCASAIYAI